MSDAYQYLAAHADLCLEAGAIGAALLWAAIRWQQVRARRMQCWRDHGMTKGS